MADQNAVVDALKGRPEMRSHDRPWYQALTDKVTDWIGGPNATMQQAEVVRALLGPSNPVNIPGQVHEGVDKARGAYAGGDWGGVASGIGQAALAVAPFPYVPRGVRPGKPHVAAEIPVPRTEVPPPQVAAIPDPMPSQPGIRAYHGSPHNFDRFDSSKIGTGEGAQAFGHGLYFAENEGVAKAYRDQLSDYSDAVRWMGAEPPSPAQKSLIDQLKGTGPSGRGMTVDALRNDLIRTRRHFEADARGDLPFSPSPDGAKQLAKTEADLAELDRMRPMIDVRQPGHMYEVNINARPEQFVDWDLPMRGQSPTAQAAIRNLEKDYADSYLMKNDQTFGDHFSGYQTNDPGLIQKLRDGGAAGIRYKDRASRGADGGSSNYVVFDDKLISILRKYGLAGPAALGAAASQSSPSEAAR